MLWLIDLDFNFLYFIVKNKNDALRLTLFQNRESPSGFSSYACCHSLIMEGENTSKVFPSL